MSDIKLLRILDQLSARVAGITVSGGYYTDIGKNAQRGQFIFNAEDTPAVAVFLQPGDNGGTAENAIKTDTGITIRGVHQFSIDAEGLAVKMLADIHAAIEVDSAFAPGPSDLIRRVQEQGWQIIYPEDNSGLVSVEVNYSFSYNRRYGED